MIGNSTNESNQNQGSPDSSSLQVKTKRIILPKGRGAIRSISEKFAANSVTGTSIMSVLFATSLDGLVLDPSFQSPSILATETAQLAQGSTYSLFLVKPIRVCPNIMMRLTDVFILSGSEGLVLELKPDNQRYEDTVSKPGYIIHRDRSCIEGLFARTERWIKVDGEVFWCSYSKDNILTLYGMDANSRITDPEHPQRIFSWLICETRDDKGSSTVYRQAGTARFSWYEKGHYRYL